MAFALTLFVEAAHKTAHFPQPPRRIVVDDVCALLYNSLCGRREHRAAAVPRQVEPQAGLYPAFRVVCSHYEGDPLQAAICARVLAFYFLMEQTAGEALAEWVESLPETPQFVNLHPAVLEALGTVELNGSVPLSPTAFPRLVARIAASNERDGRLPPS